MVALSLLASGGTVILAAPGIGYHPFASMLLMFRRSLPGCALLMIAFAVAGCGRPDDPARVALRQRLAQEAALSPAELGQLVAEVNRGMAGKTFHAKDGESTRALGAEQHEVVFGMLSDPIGMFDEGRRESEGGSYRILNAPGPSSNAEIEVIRRLWIDIETLLPGRFQFNYAFPNPDDYTLDLVEAR